MTDMPSGPDVAAYYGSATRERHRQVPVADAKRQAMKWMPISEAPRDGTRVLGWQRPSPGRGDMRWTMEWDAARERWIIAMNPFWDFQPTHWMALPEPPEGQGT